MDCSSQSFLGTLALGMHASDTHVSRFPVLIRRTILLLLLLSVPALTTLARNNWYLPRTNPGHYLTTASKTKVAPCSVQDSQPPVEPIAKEEAPPRPEPVRIRRSESAPTIVWTDLPLVVQRRPPPAQA